jgi:hypothetical protein
MVGGQRAAVGLTGEDELGRTPLPFALELVNTYRDDVSYCI